MMPRIPFLLAVLAACVPCSLGQQPANAITPLELRTKNNGGVWLYLPPNAPADAKVPCVVVPPAGTRLFHGMILSEGDRPEHLPYAAAGFAVISFDISGPWSQEDGPSKLQPALRAFTMAKCGVADALEAVEAALSKDSRIDPKRLYVAGHSSAATLSLQIASSTDQFKACVAFAPTVNVPQDFGVALLSSLDRVLPRTAATIRELSPSNRVESFHCPILLFHALDDSTVPPQSILSFKDDLLAHQKSVEYVSVPTGGHYNSMIKEGIPKAISWLKAIDSGSAK